MEDIERVPGNSEYNYRHWNFDETKQEWVWCGWEIGVETCFKNLSNEYVMIYVYRNGVIRSSVNVYPCGRIHGSTDDINFIAQVVLDFGAVAWEHEYDESLNIPENLLRNIAESYLSRFDWVSVSFSA